MVSDDKPVFGGLAVKVGGEEEPPDITAEEVQDAGKEIIQLGKSLKIDDVKWAMLVSLIGAILADKAGINVECHNMSPDDVLGAPEERH